MYVRANIFSGDPSKVDDAIAYAESTLVPAVTAIAGNRGLAMAVDRATGDGSVVTFWDDLDALRASEEQVKGLRNQTQSIMSGTVDVRVMEVVERHISHRPAPGCWNRVTMLQMSGDDDVDAAVDTFRNNTLPALQAMDGFCAATLSRDLAAARAVAVTTWRDRASLDASSDRADTLRQEVTGKAHATIDSVREQEIVVAAMRDG
jgi:quinol monooxygenase YgiN